jgi:hypothetical protein
MIALSSIANSRHLDAGLVSSHNWMFALYGNGIPSHKINKLIKLDRPVGVVSVQLK